MGLNLDNFIPCLDNNKVKSLFSITLSYTKVTNLILKNAFYVLMSTTLKETTVFNKDVLT